MTTSVCHVRTGCVRARRKAPLPPTSPPPHGLLPCLGAPSKPPPSPPRSAAFMVHGWGHCPLLACACSFGRWKRSRVQAKSEYTHTVVHCNSYSCGRTPTPQQGQVTRASEPATLINNHRTPKPPSFLTRLLRNQIPFNARLVSRWLAIFRQAGQRSRCCVVEPRGPVIDHVRFLDPADRRDPQRRSELAK